jgi:TFIIF-interacting CTD phosphatase-like protein
MRSNFYINNQTINNFNNININTLNNINDINSINRNINNQMRNQIMNNNNLLYEYQKNKISPPFLTNPCTKKYTLVLDLCDTLINIQYKDINGENIIPNFRPGLFSFLSTIKPYYELVSFTNESKEFSDKILKEIEKNNKNYFDYNLWKDHTTFHRNKFVKDISKLGRDIRKIIIIDDDPTNFELNPDNGIQISPYLGESTKDDTALFELKKLLILFNKNGGDDIRKAIKKCEKDIREKISMNNGNKKF